MQYVDIGRTRTPEQEAAYGARKTCPFCGRNEDLPQEIQERMIYTGTYWRAWHNPYPYSGHGSHIILAPLEHLTQPHELSGAAQKEWMEINVRLIRELSLPGGGLVMRFGEHLYKGGSVTHLHSHIQVPDLQSYAIAVFYADEPLKQFTEST